MIEAELRVALIIVRGKLSDLMGKSPEMPEIEDAYVMLSDILRHLKASDARKVKA